jgi:hypothetical protein
MYDEYKNPIPDLNEQFYFSDLLHSFAASDWQRWSSLSGRPIQTFQVKLKKMRGRSNRKCVCALSITFVPGYVVLYMGTIFLTLLTNESKAASYPGTKFLFQV